jgi:hypothetical protein
LKFDLSVLKYGLLFYSLFLTAFNFSNMTPKKHADDMIILLSENTNKQLHKLMCLFGKKQLIVAAVVHLSNLTSFAFWGTNEQWVRIVQLQAVCRFERYQFNATPANTIQ